MSEKVLCEKSDLVAIADAVREATGNAENYNVSELSAATVEAISTGGSDGSVETCTVTITYLVARSSLCMWSIVGYDAENGEIIQHYNSRLKPETNLTFDNVICGSVFSLYCEGMYFPSSCDVTGGAELLECGSMAGASGAIIYVKAPTTAGSVCTCTIT